MAPRKQLTVSSDINGVRVERGPAPPPLPASKLPPVIRFPLLCVVSLSLSALFYTFMADLTGYELAKTSRAISKEWETTLVIGISTWRVIELAVGWYGGFDDLDLAALTIVTHYPYLYLIHYFFEISSTTVAASLAIDTLCISLPTYLLRRRSPTHSSTSAEAEVPNRNIIYDTSVIGTTSLLGASIYTVLIFAALRLGLNTFLINNFDEVPSLAARDASNLLTLTLIFFPVGWAVREFILDPSLGSEAQPTVKDAVNSAFNPADASLKETFEHNVWAWSKRTKVVIARTVLLSTMVFANTSVQVYTRVRGAEVVGAVGWGAIFAVPAYLAGAAYLIVGDV